MSKTKKLAIFSVAVIFAVIVVGTAMAWMLLGAKQSPDPSQSPTTPEPPAPQMTTQTFADTSDVLLNPNKGFIYYGRVAPKSNDEIVDMYTVGYTRYDWVEIEPTEGDYHFELIHDAINSFASQGKKFAFGIMCCNSSSSEAYVTPQYVFDGGAASDISVRTDQPSQIIPKWKDPKFLEYLNKFVKRLGEEFDGNENIAYIDIRSYGNWGEQHLFGLNVDDNYNWRDKLDAQFFKENYVVPYMEAFPHTLLVNPWGHKSLDDAYKELLDEGVTLRRDGIVDYDNGLDTCALAYGKLPIIFEFAHSYKSYVEDGTTDIFNPNLEAAMQMAFPSYIELDKEWFKQNKEYCKVLANKMGYYFRLKKAQYFEKIKVGTETKVMLDFKNDGIAPLCNDCKVFVGLADADGNIVCKVQTNINPRTWLPNETVTETINIKFDNVQAGTYSLVVGLFSCGSTENPNILLGSEGKLAGSNWYALGQVNLAN